MKGTKETTKATGGGAKPPGPPGSLPPPRPGELRIAVEKKPYAEIIGHAILEPDVEVCGVLVGRFEEDAHGPWVRVTAAIRGEAAKEQGAAVTFTHETWNHIHGEMDRRFPDDKIVGWYHTHGGFGVFLSEMDVFVHDNFFPERNHLAYVYDPLAGSEAFFHRTEKGLEAAARYWLGGRERRPAARLPEAAPARPAAPAAPAAEPLERAVRALEAAADGRSTASLLPWIVAIAALVLLALQWREAHLAGPRARPTAVAIVDRDPMTGRVIGIPLEVLEQADGGAYVDADGNVRLGVESVREPGLLARIARPPPTEAEVAAAREKAEAAERDRAAMRRLLLWVGGAVLLAAALLGGAWIFVARRR